MNDIIFDGSAKIETYDITEAENKLAARGFSGAVIIIQIIFGAVLTAPAVLYLMLSIVLPSFDKQGEAVILLLLGVIQFISADYVRTSNGKLRIKAPINRDRHACIELYENRLSYHDEFVILNATYDDVDCLINAKNVLVFTFIGADTIIVPKRCFGWEKCRNAEAFLKEKLRGKVRG